jgi:hypothetical protein
MALYRSSDREDEFFMKLESQKVTKLRSELDKSKKRGPGATERKSTG